MKILTMFSLTMKSEHPYVAIKTFVSYLPFDRCLWASILL